MKTKQDFPLVPATPRQRSRENLSGDSKGFAEFTLAYRRNGRRFRRVFIDLKEEQAVWFNH
jgi:hypothetical protein